MKDAQGQWGRRSKCYQLAKQALRQAWRYSWADRRQKKGEFRRLWIARISAAAHMRGMNYSRLVNGLKKGGVKLNRKVLADVALCDPKTFDSIVKLARTYAEGQLAPVSATQA